MRSTAEHSAKYGAYHQRLVASYKRRLMAGEVFVCPRCGHLLAWPMAWQLDHDDDGGPRDYRGPAHARCNQSAGGRKARANDRKRKAKTKNQNRIDSVDERRLVL